MTEQDHIRAAIVKLTETLAGIARTADEKNRERCPYKTVEFKCTYAGGCRNQKHDASHFALGTSHSAVHCTGDHLIEWAPSDRS